jgi:putative membrane protein
MIMKKLLTALAVTLAASAAYAAPAPSEFVEKAGASDNFEIDSANQMLSSKNPAIHRFAREMIADHTKSTGMILTAAHADGVAPKKPELTIGQRADLTALKALPGGKTKDDLYIKQQRAAHEDALMLMQSYASEGHGSHLRATAAKIVPVVEMHRTMLKHL